MTVAAVDAALIQARHWRALGTNVDLLVLDGDADAAQAAVTALLNEVDRTYSRFRPDSELVAVNSKAGRTQRLSPLLAQAIAAALLAARQTDGLSDPTVGRTMTRIGYDTDFASVSRSSGPIELKLERVPGWAAVDFDANARTLRAPEGVELDLGATGKALASDLGAPVARAAGRAEGVLLSLGGDLALAGAVPPGGWQVLVTDNSDTDPTSPGDVVAVHRGAMATSSTTVRRWRRGSIELHHVIDPRTGLPAVTPWRTVTVAATSCVDANAAATSGLILGAQGPSWLSERGFAARLVDEAGHIITVGSWPVGNLFDRIGSRDSAAETHPSNPVERQRSHEHDR